MVLAELSFKQRSSTTGSEHSLKAEGKENRGGREAKGGSVGWFLLVRNVQSLEQGHGGNLPAWQKAPCPSRGPEWPLKKRALGDGERPQTSPEPRESIPNRNAA